MGEGSFGDNLFHPNKLQLKIEKLPVNKDIESDVYGVFVKGSPEVDLSLPIVLIFKLFDKLTSSPIVSTFDTFMEENSRVFEHKCELGDMSGKYYPDWTKVSAVIPDTLIGPYKGKVEAWYVGKQGLIVYFSLILLTIWVIFFPKSNLVWRLFKDLPCPPDILKKDLNFPS